MFIASAAGEGITCPLTVAFLGGTDHPSTSTELSVELLSTHDTAAPPLPRRGCHCCGRFLLSWLLPVSARGGGHCGKTWRCGRRPLSYRARKPPFAVHTPYGTTGAHPRCSGGRIE